MSDRCDSVIVWLRQLEAGDQDAAAALWERYFDRLVGLARKRLGFTRRREFDEEDIAVSVFHCLDRCARDGRLGEMASREELWRLLVAMTRQKVIDKVRHVQCEKRGGGQVRGESVFGNSLDANDFAAFEAFASDEPNPEWIMDMEERYEFLMNLLPDDTYRQVAVLRMQGHTNQEIAEQFAISERSVERKLQNIRKCWRTHLETLDGAA